MKERVEEKEGIPPVQQRLVVGQADDGRKNSGVLQLGGRIDFVSCSCASWGVLGGAREKGNRNGNGRIQSWSFAATTW